MIVIDGSVLKYLICFGTNYRDQILQNPNVFAHAFFDGVLQYSRKFNGCRNNKVYVVVDMRGKFKREDDSIHMNYWRQKYYTTTKDIMLNPNNDYTSYKFKREKTEKKDNVDWNAIENLYHEILETLDLYTDITVIKIPYLEADDIASILVQHNNSDVENIIITNDKDIKQLVTKSTKLFNPYTRELEINGMNEEEKTLFYLCGDVSDSIPPVLNRTKEKTWLKLLSEKTLEQIFNESKEPLLERFEINKKIMCLEIDNLPPKLVQKVIDKYNENNFKFNEMKLVKELKKYKLHTFVKQGTKSVAERYKEFKLSDNDLTKNIGKFDMRERAKEKIESLFDSN